MKSVITTENAPIKLWLDDAEDGAIQQAKNLANLPFIHKHVVLLPDSHQGYGMPIGGVIATKDVIIPHAVGNDIGCGMAAVKTSIQNINTTQLKSIMSRIRELIPVGKNRRKIPVPAPSALSCLYENTIIQQEYKASRYQIGTLGSGNHFIEIQKDKDNFIWIMLHSGSRNLGFKVAQHYNNLAKQHNQQWYSSVPKEYELAFLPLNSKQGEYYSNEMTFCVQFAKENRIYMLNTIMNIFTDYIQDITFENTIDVAHNYASLENHFGKNVFVHRKGATRARKDEIGIIPGSQGTSSYIVKGKGNKDSFESCSHGAGRLMSRTKAKKELSIDKECALLNNLGVIHSIRSIDDLDEAPSAYKDIDIVMQNQTDLVDIITKLTPIAVIKG